MEGNETRSLCESSVPSFFEVLRRGRSSSRPSIHIGRLLVLPPRTNFKQCSGLVIILNLLGRFLI